MRETIGAVVRKPVFRIKLIAISLLFVVSLIEQVSNNYIQSSGQQVGRMTVILLLMHTFSYFSFYLSVFFVGYILLIPDIVKDAFIERQTMMRCQSRMRAAKYAIGKIIAFSILYVIWFVMLTILVGGIWFHDFSLAWPKFMDIQQRQLAANGLCNSLEYLTQRDIQTKNSGVNVRYRGKHRFFKGFNEFIKEKTRRCDNDFEKIERHVFF